MADFHVTSNTADLARQLAGLGLELNDAVESATREAGAVILAAAHAPRRSGALAASLRADASPTGTVVGSSLRYATFVHWGAPRRHVRAQPFLLSALHATEQELMELYLNRAGDALATIKG